jgi:hypothetical protein
MKIMEGFKALTEISEWHIKVIAREKVLGFCK